MCGWSIQVGDPSAYGPNSEHDRYMGLVESWKRFWYDSVWEVGLIFLMIYLMVCLCIKIRVFLPLITSKESKLLEIFIILLKKRIPS